MNLLKTEYIILELIPTHSNPKKGDIIQLSALKINGLELLDRFDYRLNENCIFCEDFKKIIDYDKENFKYVDSTKQILDEFQKWAGNLPLLIIDNQYTYDYLEKIENKKESVFKYMDLSYNDNIIEEIISKFGLEPSNYIVDLLYESLIKVL